ncbi:GH39 family glycosyl hydrolase [Bacillus sp. PS06]|uniref:GH39 family glycosyl hydrolase n=1 Tax=Bacillus sp. PS06 TaxID=2764176 RepID=UPI00177A89B8|nr:xylan 1,4-beta-xylosidase [Bacillus sp. PS06]MBD8069061.1 xylan 1,4-beta-xylosidase [Bacillus sp. PS06]
MEIIQVQTDNVKTFNKNWQYCVGTGRLGLALQQEYLDHLKLAKEKIGFKYIRGHGLLSDDVGIYRELQVGDEVRPFYNFTYIDRIFDSFLELDIRPFVEFGFMPKKLASGDQTIFYWEGNVTPPKDYQKWHDLIVAVVSHFIERYGEEEVLKWPFEVWNEPNLVNFWKDADQAEYFKLYKVTALAVKSVHPDLLVGGPAICGGADHWITDFLSYCEREEVPIDFVSRHAYTSKAPKKVTPDYYYQDLEENTDMLEQFKMVRGLIDDSPFPNLPFHITEYNTSYSPINPVHDTPLNAAYLARILSEGGDFVDSFSYWTFSDVFEELDVPKAQFHGGFGLIGLNRIPKPTFHLFSFFNQLGEELLYRDDKIIVTRRANGSISLVAWNVVMEKGRGYERTIEMKIPVPCKENFIKRQTVDENHANPWKAWQQMGRPRFPDKASVETLRALANPKVSTERTQTEDGMLTLAMTLTKNEVTLVEITPVHDETDTYIGLDDSLITSY